MFLIFSGWIHPEFDASKINEYVNEREVLNEDGFKISEWIIKTKDVIYFYNDIIDLAR